MAHLWALEVVVLAWFGNTPLPEALELEEFSGGLDAHWLLKE